jgi:hypothetical protein
MTQAVIHKAVHICKTRMFENHLLNLDMGQSPQNGNELNKDHADDESARVFFSVHNGPIDFLLRKQNGQKQYSLDSSVEGKKCR